MEYMGLDKPKILFCKSHLKNSARSWRCNRYWLNLLAEQVNNRD